MTNNTSMFVPFPWQVPAWKSKAGTLLLTGAAGGGKSRLAGEKIHGLMLHYPKSTGIVGRKDRTSAMRSVVPLLLYTIMGDTEWGVYHKSDGVFEYSNGSMLWVAGVRDESQRENLRSIGRDGSADVVWFEEANKLTQLDDNEITARMRGNNMGWRQKIYSTNPDGPDHWIKKRLIDAKMADTYYSRPEDNPTNPADYIIGLQNLVGVSKDRLWHGLWVQAEGAIYVEYDSSIHLREKEPIIDPHARWVMSVDFGYTNPFSCTLWKINHDGIILQTRQIYHTRRTINVHAVSIKQMLREIDLPIHRIEAWICDHDAEDRATLEEQLGIATIAAYKAITHGIDAVKTRLKDKRLYLYNGAVTEVDEELEKLYKPTCTADEISNYVWSDKKQDTPVDENNHGLDEMRYVVAYIDRIDKNKILIGTKARIQNYISGNKAAVPERPGY